ncbi:flagellar hook-length control protein FliK [Bordetella sp. 15P40C-2]|uniref:flagellar hook-length control protein FliK n=1 Tax=Bordetella sp. 15P40C-2 TaxID=2572246 RepID=UPI001329FE07|nr:flagellar hook-length control protein FliK [Bordetella sp. 15P40C-2]MVW69958.1 hypothetical protein [Bordetella sp. 15P40C-2]
MTTVSPPLAVVPNAPAASPSHTGNHADASHYGFTQLFDQLRVRQDDANAARQSERGNEDNAEDPALTAAEIADGAEFVEVADDAIPEFASEQQDEADVSAAVNLTAVMGPGEAQIAGGRELPAPATTLLDTAQSRNADGRWSPDAPHKPAIDNAQWNLTTTASGLSESALQNAGQSPSAHPPQTQALATDPMSAASELPLGPAVTGFLHQTQRELRPNETLARTVKAAKQLGRQLPADGISARAIRQDPDTPKLDLRTRNFVNTLEASVALNRNFARNTAAEQSAVAPAAASMANADLASAATAMASQPATSNVFGTPSQVAYLGVNTPVLHPAWAQAMSQQVLAFLKMDESGNQIAQLRLDPPELGPLRVAIAIKDGVATANFVCANSAVRSAVEQALPELASQLQDAGLSLGQSSVGEHESREYADAQGSSGGEAPGAPTDNRANGVANTSADDLTPTHSAKRQALGLINAYA